MTRMMGGGDADGHLDDDGGDEFMPGESVNLPMIESEEMKERRPPLQYSLPQHRKPKWWYQVAGRRGTKAQRRALETMKDYQLQQGLEYGSMIDWTSVFPPIYTDIWLELGCGQGDTVMANAHRQQHDGHRTKKNVAFVGADIHSASIGAALVRMKSALNEHRYWTGYSLYHPSKDPHVRTVKDGTADTTGDDTAADIGHKHAMLSTSSVVVSEASHPLYSNVRFHRRDGTKLLQHIPTSSLTCILLTFPDPFPKSADADYRLVQVAMLRELHRVLDKSRGRFFLATDHEGHFEWCNTIFDRRKDLFRRVSPCPDRMTWLPAISKYEQKGWDEGRKTMLACWEVEGNDSGMD